MDLDLRRLRYFVTVADELSFVRAADRLHMTQPALSRQIRTLEDEIGVVLFDRGPVGTVLTRAGAQLLEDARPMLEGATELLRRARLAARPDRHFTVGFMPGVIVTPIVRRFKALAPDIVVGVLHTSITDQVDYLLDGRVDVCFVRLPIPTNSIEVVPLFPEPRVAALAADHPLAEADVLDIEVLAKYPLLQDPRDVPEWRGDPRDAAGYPVGGVEESLEAVASGHGFIVLAAGIAGFYRRPDIRYIPLTGVAPRMVALAYGKQRAMPAVEAFARISREELAPAS
ncbi:LysR family transcriptional regulator [Dactylosporangium sp. CA-092794]|uniref:LysR family transcriptional regulator n=1 Tax=Dactylosporangium sp. CA-092794 TaxID=3239929 RepID=UPI003D8CEE09